MKIVGVSGGCLSPSNYVPLLNIITADERPKGEQAGVGGLYVSANKNLISIALNSIEDQFAIWAIKKGMGAYKWIWIHSLGIKKSEKYVTWILPFKNLHLFWIHVESIFMYPDLHLSHLFGVYPTLQLQLPFLSHFNEVEPSELQLHAETKPLLASIMWHLSFLLKNISFDFIVILYPYYVYNDVFQ